VFKKASILIVILMVLNIFSIPVLAVEDYNSSLVTKILSETNVKKLRAKASILMDKTTGQIILEQNSHERLPIASVTKVMSMLLIMEAIDSGKISFEDYVPISVHSYNMGGSEVWLEPGEKVTVKEMFDAIAIHSANDATVAMAEFVGGSEEIFVAAMNKKAKALGMDDTHFHDSTGLDDKGYSSAYDVCVMSRELVLKHPKIIEFTKIWHTTFRNGKVSLDNTNKLIWNYKGTIGLKTGFTTKAGYNLSAIVEKENLTFISVVLGEPDSNTRFAESQKLMDYAFSNYSMAKVSNKSEKIVEADVSKGVETKVQGIYKSDVNLLVKTGSEGKIVKDVRLQKDITAPIKAGQKIGEVIYKVDNKEIGKADIVAEKKVEKASFIRLFFRMILSWFGIGK